MGNFLDHWISFLVFSGDGGVVSFLVSRQFPMNNVIANAPVCEPLQDKLELKFLILY
jgi:hypothetical protein